MRTMTKYVMPIKREIWENYGSFIKMPLMVMALFALLLVAGGIMGTVSDKTDIIHLNSTAFQQYSVGEGAGQYGNIHIGSGVEMRTFEYTDEVVDGGEVGGSHFLSVEGDFTVDNDLAALARTPFIVFGHLMSIVAFMYLLACLYDDRKNSSILFWKSLPVSELQNVLTKVCVALCVIPAIAWLCALIFSVFFLVCVVIGGVFNHYDAAVWVALKSGPFILVATALQYAGVMLASALWILPLMAWLLLVSAYAKSAVFLHAVLPLLAVVICENILFDSADAAFVFKSYLLNTGPFGGGHMLHNPSWWSFWTLLTSGQFWVGLMAAFAMLYGAMWLRENRFEM